MFKQVSRGIALLLLCAIALAGCAPAPTAAPTTAPRPRLPLRPPLPPRPPLRLQLPRPLRKAPLQLLLAVGAPTLKSSSSPAEHPVEASSRSFITARTGCR